jgi:hypothetical protein
MKFVKLTHGFNTELYSVYVNPNAIAYIEEAKSNSQEKSTFTRIVYISGTWHAVHESIEEILKLIEETK